MIEISGVSGNEIFCLAQKGLAPAEIVVGNSVRSIGIGGSLRMFGQSFAGGEVRDLTDLISEGRHDAIRRMEDEAKRHHADGVTGVEAELRSFAGYSEFLAQGTSVRAAGAVAASAGAKPGGFFSTSASGIELYCHLDAGYKPIRFCMGTIAYALGVGRGLTGGLRTLSQGEVHEYSAMYNGIRHTALERLAKEAAGLGANAVVDVDVEIRPFGGAVELLLVGTASHHDRLKQGKLAAAEVATSELTGEEIWNLAKLGYAPRRLVLATSIYSLGVAAGIGALFKAMKKGELPEVTKLIYHARENCLDHIRKEAEAIGAERVVGNRLSIHEIAPGLIEVLAIGTAVSRIPDVAPASEALIPQAIIVDRDIGSLQLHGRIGEGGAPRAGQPGCGTAAAALVAVLSALLGLLALLAR